jgi:hypothetical protein
VKHLSDWWLLGTRDNAAWGINTADTCNAYVAAATSGGLFNLACLVALLGYSFKYLGIARQHSDQLRARRIWSYGASLTAHAVAFIGIAYFDQMTIFWYAFLATIVILVTSTASRSPELQAESPEEQLQLANG